MCIEWLHCKGSCQRCCRCSQEETAGMHLIASEKLLHSASEDVIELALCCIYLKVDHISASSVLAQLPYVKLLQNTPASIHCLLGGAS